MGQKNMILTLLTVLSLFGCQSNSENKLKKVNENGVEEEKYSPVTLNDTTDCFLLLEMLKKECINLTARLSVSTLKQVVILVPSDKYDLDCDQFTLGKIPVFVNHQLVNLDSVGKYKPKEDEPVRVFYLMDYKRRNNYKSIELFYIPSGGIFKIVVKIDGGKAVIEDFFCANF